MSTENKFSLLASLTSLPSDQNQQPQDDDDNILPSLAVEDDTGSSFLKSSAESNTGDNNQKKTVNVGVGVGVGGLLGSSGLLTSFGSTANAGGGLFDQLEEEEERKAQALKEEQRERELQREREQLQLEQQRQLEAEEKERVYQMQMQKEREEQERAAVAAAAQAAAAAAVQESNVNVNGGNNVMGGLQELSLNDEHAASMGYRPEMNTYSNVMQSGIIHNEPTHPNGAGMMHQQPLQQHQQHQHQHQNQHTMQPQQPPTDQNSMQYPTQEPPPIPQEQPPMQQHQQQQQQQQQIQQAGYGASSYYYSTTGNVQQIHQQQPTTHVSNPNQTMSYSNTQSSSTTQNNNNLSSSSYAQRSQMLNQSVSTIPTNPPMNNGNMNGNGNMNANMNGNNNVNGNSPYSQPTVQQHQQHNQPQPQQPYSNMYQSNMNGMNQQQPPLTNGNNAHHILNKPIIKPPPYNPDSFKPMYGNITVTDPILIQAPGVFSGPPHWIYNVVVRDLKKVAGQDQFSAVVNNVRRRFRHFVALEDRLRAECPGAILPPRPNKHSTRAIDEASTRQSTQFALQRARELETYLNALRLHPLAGKASNLQLFLTLPDHLGAAWPEVSSSIFTRLTEVGTSTATKISESTSAVMSELNNESQIMAGEDNSELLALASAEGLRIGSVLQAVPKIEGVVTLTGEIGERMSVSGLEAQKLVNNVFAHEREFSAPFETLSSGFLRCGRRTSRLAIELGAATQVFTLQHKLCRYERMAFGDRRSALVRRRDAKIAAEKKAQKLVVQQHSMQSMGQHGMYGGVERDAAMSGDLATTSFNEAEEIGQILQCEVGRIADMRKKDWSMSLKVIAANMRETHAERAAIWQGCRDSLLAELNGFDGAAPTGEIEDVNGHEQQQPNMVQEVAHSTSEVMN